MCLAFPPALGWKRKRREREKKNNARGRSFMTENKAQTLQLLLNSIHQALVSCRVWSCCVTEPESWHRVEWDLVFTSFLEDANLNLLQQPASVFLPRAGNQSPVSFPHVRVGRTLGKLLPEHTLRVHPTADSLKEWCMDMAERGRWPPGDSSLQDTGW